MNKYLKIFGITCGVLAFFFCLCSGSALAKADQVDINVYHSLGYFIIGMAFFTGPLLIILSLRTGKTAIEGQRQEKPINKPINKPIKKSKETQKAKSEPPKSAEKPGTESDKDVNSIYIGNLSPEANETVLKTAFSGFGEIKKIRIVKDRGRPKGFAFVEMYGKENAERAIEAMNGQELAGRTLKVSQAKTKPKSGTKNHPKKKENNNNKVISDEPMRPNIFE